MGLQGPQGEPGPGVALSLFSATNTATQSFTQDGLVERVHFPNVLISTNSSVTQQGDTDFVINRMGLYEINYRFSVRSDTPDAYTITFNLRRGNDVFYQSETKASQGYNSLVQTVAMCVCTVHLYLFGGNVIQLGRTQMSGNATATFTISNPYISFQRIGD